MEKIVDLTIHQPREAPVIEPPLAQEVPQDASMVLSLSEHSKFFRRNDTVHHRLQADHRRMER
jgi:hypothetical protein